MFSSTLPTALSLALVSACYSALTPGAAVAQTAPVVTTGPATRMTPAIAPVAPSWGVRELPADTGLAGTDFDAAARPELRVAVALSHSNLARQTLSLGEQVAQGDPQAAAPQASQPLDLDSLIDIALQLNPMVQSKAASMSASRIDVTAARRQALPALSAQVQGARNSHGGSQAELTVKQPLYTFGALAARIAAAQRNVDVAERDVGVTRRQLAREVIDAWASLVEGKQLLALVSDIQLENEKYRGMMMRRVEGGVSASAELELLNTRVVLFDADATRYAYQVSSAVERLFALTGGALPKTAIQQLSAAPPPAPAEALLRQAQDTLAQVVSETPEVRKAEAVYAAAVQKLEADHASTLPRIEMAWSLQQASKAEVRERLPRSSSVMVMLSYDSSNGFSNRVSLQADAERLKALQSDVSSAQQVASRDLMIDVNVLQAEQQKGPTYAQSVTYTRQVLESYERQFVAGRKTWSDVLNALRDFQNARLAEATNRVAQQRAAQSLRVRLQAL